MCGFQSVSYSEAGNWGGLCGGLNLSDPYHWPLPVGCLYQRELLT